MPSKLPPNIYTLRSGRQLPKIGLGVFQAPKGETSVLVELALNNGYRLIDTAKFYMNEKEAVDGIASFLRKNPSVKREEIFYTTKLWLDSMGYENARKAITSQLKAAEAIGYIDLFLIHAPRTTPEDRLGSYKALQEAVLAGKIKDIGVSNYGIHHLEEILSSNVITVKPSVNQIEINPWLQHRDIVEFCHKNNIVVEAYSPLMRGYRLDDPELEAMAKKYNKSVAQILIRWNIYKGVVPLPKSSNETRLKQNINLDFKMEDSDIESFGDASAYYVTLPSWDPTTDP